MSEISLMCETADGDNNYREEILIENIYHLEYVGHTDKVVSYQEKENKFRVSFDLENFSVEILGEATQVTNIYPQWINIKTVIVGEVY